MSDHEEGGERRSGWKEWGMGMGRTPEFERLRAEVDLQDVKSISCACVCRVLPENEEEYIAANQPDRSNISSIFAIPDDPNEGDDYDDSDYNGFDRDPGSASLDRAMDSVVAILSRMSRMMVTPSGDCIKIDGGVIIDNEDDNIFRPPRGHWS